MSEKWQVTPQQVQGSAGKACGLGVGDSSRRSLKVPGVYHSERKNPSDSTGVRWSFDFAYRLVSLFSLWSSC